MTSPLNQSGRYINIPLSIRLRERGQRVSRCESNQGAFVDKLSGRTLIGGRGDLCGESLVTWPPIHTITPRCDGDFHVNFNVQ